MRKKPQAKPQPEPVVAQPIIYVIDELHRLPDQVLKALQHDRDQFAQQAQKLGASSPRNANSLTAPPTPSFIVEQQDRLNQRNAQLSMLVNAVHVIADQIHGPSPATGDNAVMPYSDGLVGAVDEISRSVDALATALRRIDPNISL